MTDEQNKSLLRAIPSIDDLLKSEAITSLRAEHPNFPWTRFVRRTVNDFRKRSRKQAAKKGRSKTAVKEALIEEITTGVRILKQEGVRRVINGTGVILHTNLGRAILGRGVREAVGDVISHYVNLEFDLDRGERSKRGEVLHQLITLSTGAEACAVVNNNAAAVYLIANTFSPPGRVIISRGELIEIGGSFRLPAILESAAEEVVEVGTTNRTYIEDFEKNASRGDVLMKVHKSNYEIKGFAHDVALSEIVDLARRKKCVSVYDLGSGALYDFESAGFQGEAQVEKVLASGVDCVTMSGDKLLGGVQTGIILGKAKVIEALKENPMRRAFRVDKIYIAALEALFRCYLFDRDPVHEVPALEQAFSPVATLKKRAGKIRSRIARATGEKENLAVVEDQAAIGGGSFAGKDIPGIALAVRCESEKDAVSLARAMRNHTRPLIARVKGREVRINLRSVFPEEDRELAEHLGTILKKKQR